MILFLTPSNVASPSKLRVKKVPKRFLSLGLRVFPKGRTSALYWRTVFDFPAVRCVFALSPFPIILLFKPEWALPVSLAPVPMARFVLMIENNVLSVASPSARRGLVPEVERERGLDLLKVRAEAILTRLSAARNPGPGLVHLVIEQSEILRVSPLTYVSVQIDGPEPGFLDLTEDEQAMIAETIFDDAFDEAQLRLINTTQNTQIRTFELDPSRISAHARLAALATSTG
ncbi:MAG: hypothetical protein AAF908_04210 [Pseudomonadota bacterium]